MKARRTLAIICYTVCICVYGAAGYLSYIAVRGVITYTLGFMLFLPLWIISYWFSTFFTQLSNKEAGEEGITWYIPRKASRVMVMITNVISILMLAFWAVIYFAFM